MDAEKRHQLKTNELAEALGKLRDFGGDPQTRLLLIALAVILVAVVGYRVWGYVRDSNLAGQWQEFSQVAPKMGVDPDGAIGDLRSLIADASSPALAAAARISLAGALRRVAEEDPQREGELLAEVVETLEPVVGDSELPASLVAAAAYSLGTSYESLRDFDKAAEAYGRIADVERFAGSPFAMAAAERLATLDEVRAPVRFEPGMPPLPEVPPAPAPATEEAPAASQPTDVPSEPATSSAPSP